MDLSSIPALIEQAAATIGGSVKLVDSLKGLAGRFAGDKSAAEARDIVGKLAESLTTLRMINLTLAEQANALQTANMVLQAQIDRKTAFEARAVNYESRSYADGTFAKVLKAEIGKPESPEKLCPNCFENEKFSYFSFDSRTTGVDIWSCPSCKTIIRIPNGTTATVHVRRVVSRGIE